MPIGQTDQIASSHSCQNGMLAPPTSSPDNPTTSTFRVVVEYDPTTSYSGDIQANGLVFRIGGDPATYCPLDIEDCPLGIETDWTCSSDICNLVRTSSFSISSSAVIFLLAFADITQNVEVPGGQQIYVAPNGAVSFTQAHSGLAPTGSIFAGFSVEDDGGLTFAGGDFLSCPPVDQTQNYQLYAAAIATPSDDCISIRLLTAATTTDDFGAWQYT